MHYRYFLDEFLIQRDLYRCPKNDQDFLENSNTLAVEYFDPEKNAWTKDQDKIRGVVNEMFSGWFSENSGEISEAKALQIINRLQKYMNKTNQPFELSLEEVDDFITNYTYADRLFIGFDWNGEHGEKFKDGNLEFRATVTKRFLELDSANVILARDLYVTWAECSKEGWSVSLDVIPLAEKLLELGKGMYVMDFLRGAFLSFDMICSARAITISTGTIAICRARLEECNKIFSEDSKEDRRLIKNGIDLFEDLVLKSEHGEK